MEQVLWGQMKLAFLYFEFCRGKLIFKIMLFGGVLVVHVLWLNLSLAWNLDAPLSPSDSHRPEILS